MGISRSPYPIPLLLGATLLYALNTARARALETIPFTLSMMIGGEEGVVWQ